jgi:hypothetical protein
MIVIMYDNVGLFGGIVPWYSSAWNIHGRGQEVCDLSHVLLIMTDLRVGATGLFFHTDTRLFSGRCVLLQFLWVPDLHPNCIDCCIT